MRWIAVLAWLSICGCASQERPARPAAEALAHEAEPMKIDPTGAESATSDRWIQSVAEAHGRADTAHEPAAVKQAIDHLTRVFETGPTRAGATAVRQDVAGRIAGFHRRLDQFDQAADWARRGLAVSGPPTVFTAHLHLEAALAADALGDKQAARSARDRAQRLNATLRVRP